MKPGSKKENIWDSGKCGTKPEVKWKNISEWKLFNQSQLETKPKFLSHCKKKVNSSQPVIKKLGDSDAKRLFLTSRHSLTRTSLSSVQKLSECVHTCTYTLLKY